jgi:hypothetical protein
MAAVRALRDIPQRDDRDMTVLMATIEVRLRNHEDQMARLNSHIFYGNGKASLDVQIAQVLDAVQRLTVRQDEWRRWFWGLAGSVILSLGTALVLLWTRK